MIMRVTWHDEPAMSFKDHTEASEMLACSFDPGDESELKGLVYLSMKGDTVNL